MPQIPGQQLYYSRQLYQYHFCMVQNQEDKSVPKHGVHCYTCSEDESAKGSNEVASALHSSLRSLSYKRVQEVHLAADSCAGQNKNSTTLGMLLWWLKNEVPAQVLKTTLVFSVTGHSFLPPDRVFSRIEKDTRKHEEILNPDAYKNIFAEHGTVLKLGKHWNVYDWNAYAMQVLKPTLSLPFKISMVKVFYMQLNANRRSPEVRAEPHYRFSVSNFVRVLQKGKDLSGAPERCGLQLANLNPLKVKDVMGLLVKHFAEWWQQHEELKYFSNVFSRFQDQERGVDKQEECACCQEDTPVHI